MNISVQRGASVIEREHEPNKAISCRLGPLKWRRRNTHIRLMIPHTVFSGDAMFIFYIPCDLCIADTKSTSCINLLLSFCCFHVSIPAFLFSINTRYYFILSVNTSMLFIVGYSTKLRTIITHNMLNQILLGVIFVEKIG